MADSNRLTLTDKDGDTLTIEDATDSRYAAFVMASEDGVLLSARQVRQLIDRLEPLAASPLTALDIFNEFPVGQVFTRGDSAKRVKVSMTHYVLLRDVTGEPVQHPAAHTLEGFAATSIKAVS